MDPGRREAMKTLAPIDAFDGHYREVRLPGATFLGSFVAVANPEASMSADSTDNAKLIPVTDATFAEQVLGSETPVLVKFEADWCGPCKAMKPMVEEIAAEYSGRLTVATLDIEQNNQTVYRMGVRAVPTVVLFKNGQVFAQKVGLPRKADLTALIDKAVA
jgi:thioredoxin 1